MEYNGTHAGEKKHLDFYAVRINMFRKYGAARLMKLEEDFPYIFWTIVICCICGIIVPLIGFVVCISMFFMNGVSKQIDFSSNDIGYASVTLALAPFYISFFLLFFAPEFIGVIGLVVWKLDKIQLAWIGWGTEWWKLAALCFAETSMIFLFCGLLLTKLTRAEALEAAKKKKEEALEAARMKAEREKLHKFAETKWKTEIKPIVEPVLLNEYKGRLAQAWDSVEHAWKDAKSWKEKAAWRELDFQLSTKIGMESNVAYRKSV